MAYALAAMSSYATARRRGARRLGASPVVVVLAVRVLVVAMGHPPRWFRPGFAASPAAPSGVPHAPPGRPVDVGSVPRRGHAAAGPTKEEQRMATRNGSAEWQGDLQG